MACLGIVLLVIGFVLTIHILWILGIVLLVVGVIFALLGRLAARWAVEPTTSGAWPL